MATRRYQDEFAWDLPSLGLPVEAAPSSASLPITDTWTGTNGAAWPAQWTDQNGSAGYTVDIQGNRGRLVTGSAGGYADNAYATLDHVDPDIDVTVSVRFTTVTECYPGIIFRDEGGGDRYLLRFEPHAGLAVLARIDAYSGTTLVGTYLVSQTGSAVAANDVYHARIHALGSEIKAKWWADGDPEPGGWQIEVTDGTYAGTTFSLALGGSSAASSTSVEWDDLDIVAAAALPDPYPFDAIDFTGTDGDQWPNPWITDGTGVADRQSNKGRLQADSGGYDYHWAIYNARLTADIDFAGSVTIDGTDEQYIRIFLGGETISGNSIPDGYTLQLLPSYGGWNMQVFSSYSATDLSGSFVSLTYAPGDVVHWRAQRVGTTIRAKVWLNGDPEPGSWGWSGTDSTHTGGEYAAVFIQSGWPAVGRTALFDDIVFSEAVLASGVDAPAELASATSSGHAPSTDIDGRPSASSASGSAHNASTIVRPGAGVGSSSGTSFPSATSVRPGAGLASGSGSAHGVTTPPTDATNSGVARRWSVLTQSSLGSIKGPNSFGAGRPDRQWAARLVNFIGVETTDAPAGTGAASGTAYNASVSTRPNAGSAAGSGSALSVSSTRTATAGVATAASTAHGASTAERTNPGVATAASTAHAPAAGVRPNTGAGAGVGAAFGSTSTVRPTAQAPSGSGTAHNASVVTSFVSQAASASGSSQSPTAAVRPTAGTGTATSTAYNPSALASEDIDAPAGAGSGSGTAYNASVLVRPSAQAPTATSTAHDADAIIRPGAQVATGSGAAQQPAASLRPTPGVATASGSALSPPVVVGSSPTTATAAGQAHTLRATITTGAGAATASGTAHGVSGSVSDAGESGVATATASAYNPSSGVRPSAQAATSSGAAHNASVRVSGLAGAGSAAGSAYTASAITTATAEVATAVGEAHTATTDQVVSTDASAGLPEATGTAHSASVATSARPTTATATSAAQVPASIVRPNVGSASATGTAHNATISITDTGEAQVAGATGAAHGPSTAITTQSGAGSATGSAYNPSAASYPVVLAPVGSASATGTAHGAVSRVAPTPSAATAAGSAQGTSVAASPSPATASATATAQSPYVSERPNSASGSASGSAQPVGAGVRPTAQAPTATGTAHNASVFVAEYVSAPAGVASATSAAHTPGVARSIDLAPATATLDAATLTTTTGAISTDLTAATTTMTAQALTVTASMVMLDLGPATTTFSAESLTVTVGDPNPAIGAATTSFAASDLTVTNDISKLVDHHAAALGFMAVGQRTLIIPSGAIDDKDRPWGLRLYDRGILVANLTAATTTFSAEDLTVTAGSVSANLTAATTTFSAQAIGVNGQEADLGVAEVTLQGQVLVPAGGAISVDLGTASITATASALTSTNAARLEPGLVTFAAQTLAPEIVKGSVSQHYPQPVRVYQGSLTTSNVLLYTVPVGQFLIIKQVTLQKVAANASATRLWSVPAAGTLGTEYAFMYDVAVADTIDQEMSMVLGPGDKLYGRCATNSTVACRVDGYLLASQSLPTPKVYFRGLLATTYAEVAVVAPTNQGVVKFVSIANTSGSDRTVDISVTTTGQSPTDAGAIRRALPVPANTSVFIPLTMVLEQNEALAAKADQAGVVTLNVAGVIA